VRAGASATVPHLLIESIDVILGQIPPDAMVIPGHGPVTGVAELRKYRGMLEEVAAAVKKNLAAGKTLEQLRKENLLAPWESWGKGFVKVDDFLSVMVEDLAKK
jgi:cyclase